MSSLEIIHDGGDLAGTLCDNPYTSYAYAGGMYDTPITGSDGSPIYIPTGEKGIANSGPNSNSSSNFLNKSVYKDGYVSYVDFFGSSDNPLQDVPVPKGVFTSLNLINPLKIEAVEILAPTLFDATAKAHVQAASMAFNANRNFKGFGVASFYVDFDENDIIDITPQQPLILKPSASPNRKFLVPMQIRQCGCFDETVADNENGESSQIEGTNEAIQDSNSSAVNASISTEHIAAGGGTSTTPVHGIVMGYPYTVSVVKKTVPVSDSDFSLATGAADAAGRVMVSGNYEVTLPCPRIKVNKTTAKEGGSSNKGTIAGASRPGRKPKRQTPSQRKIQDITVVPEDQVRYMTIF